MADDTESRIAAIMAKIQTFRKHMEGAQAMRGLTTNPEVQRGAEAQIRDIQRNISYLEDSLRVLQGRRSSTGPSGAGGGASAGPNGGRSEAATPSAASTGSSGPGSYRTTSAASSASGSTYPTSHGGVGPHYNGGGGGGPLPGRDGGYPGDSSSSYLAGGPAGQGAQRRFDDKSLPTTPTSATFGGPPPGAGYGPGSQGYGYGAGQGPAGGQGGGGGGVGGYGAQGEWRPAGMGRMGTSARRNCTNLDLIKYDTPHTTAKISRMLHQLEFKLQIEKQYKQGIDKMAKLYQAEGDRKSKNDAESKRVESQSKIVLLQQSLKRYKQLHVMDESEDDSMPGSVEDRRQNLRKPLSGTLQVSVRSARDIDHAPQPRIGRSVRESIVVIKVEDTPRAKTHPSRNDRWQEDFEIAVDNANEIEVTVYDRIGTSHPVPVGMLWIRISDIVEELRKKKFGQVSTADGSPAAPGGWMPAEDLAQARPGGLTPVSSSNAMMDTTFNTPAGQPVPLGPPSEGVEAWFAVEPVGAIFLRLNFIKQNVRKRPYDARLGRQGAFRKRKEDVAEINGHKFISRQFYQIIRCALCGELLLNAAGSQCEDCRYTCHKKCAMKVVTKCISKSNAEADRDEVKINHRIPHRFVNITNIGANWCCHCGYILPLGRKNAKKCSECDLTCHADCAHLVPDLCGMSMEMANQLLSDMDAINRLKSSAKAQAPGGAAANGGGGGGQLRPQPQGRLPSGQLSQGRPQTMLDSRMSGLEQQAGSLSLVGGGGGRPQDGPYGAVPGQQPQLPPQQPPQLQPLPSQQGLDVGGRQGPGYGPAPGQPYGAEAGKQPPRPLPQQPQPGMDPRTQQGMGPGGRMPMQGSPQSGPQHVMGRPQQNTPPPQMSQQQQQPSPGMVPPHAQYGQPPQQQPQQQPPYGQVTPQPQQMPASQAPHQQQQLALQQQGASQHQLAASSSSSSSSAPASLRRKIGLNDFNFLAVLGKGNFGKVMLAEEKKSGYLYAIKVLKKEFIIENDEVESTKSEKRVFLAAARERHPFLLGLHSCFQTETRVYFVMEYVSGGDLMLHIQKEQFSPRRAKFYAAEVLLALEYFHKQGIIYRDLKLDNILLTLDGHVKVADYGLCKEDMWFGNTTSTFCGTPEFMAPEILLEQRYGRAVDWWAFGILIYEMLLGQAPFRGDDEDEIFDAILEDEPLYPIHMPPDSVSILHKLLTRDPARRLGSGPTDAEEIKAHPFFRDVNWDDMFHKRVPPPFCPTLKNPSDTSWFDAEFTSEKPTLTPVHSVLSAQDQREFASFSWTNPALA